MFFGCKLKKWRCPTNAVIPNPYPPIENSLRTVLCTAVRKLSSLADYGSETVFYRGIPSSRLTPISRGWQPPYGGPQPSVVNSVIVPHGGWPQYGVPMPKDKKDDDDIKLNN